MWARGSEAVEWRCIGLGDETGTGGPIWSQYLTALTFSPLPLQDSHFS